MNATAARTRISLKNILYATDFSPSSEIALPYARGLAESYGGTVHALHVRSLAPYPIIGPEAYPIVIEASEQQAELEAQQLDDMFRDLPHKVYVEKGDIWPVIGELIRQEHIDLIVMGTRGRTGVGRAFLGSVAEEILRQAPCPVLTVGPYASKDSQRRLEMKEILFATDFSPESLEAVPYAVSLAQEHQAQLTLLNVVPEPKVCELVNARNYVDSTMRQLRGLVPDSAKVWCEPTCVVERGEAAQKILETAVARGSDLIVLGVRGCRGHELAATHMLPSTAHTVVTQAQCPVLTVRG